VTWGYELSDHEVRDPWTRDPSVWRLKYRATIFHEDKENKKEMGQRSQQLNHQNRNKEYPCI
jgi:hypothetical protein